MCDTRLQTNYALSLVFILFGFLPILLVLEPVNLQQVMHLELSRRTSSRRASVPGSFVCAGRAAGIRERFGPLTSVLLGIASGAYTCALLCILVLGAGVVDRASKPRPRGLAFSCQEEARDKCTIEIVGIYPRAAPRRRRCQTDRCPRVPLRLSGNCRPH